MATTLLNRGLLFLFCWGVFGYEQGLAQPPIEVYGELPTVRSMAISPDGEKLGYLLHTEDGEYASIYDLNARQIMTGVRTDNLKARDVSFAGPNYAILHASETTSLVGFRGKFEYSAALSFDLTTKKIRQLLRGSDNLYPAQSGLGDIVGLNEDGRTAYMPAFVGSAGSTPNFSLMKVDLKTGRGRVHKKGNTFSRDFFVDTDGTVLAREDFDDKGRRYAIWAARDGKLKKIFEETDIDLPSVALVGVKSDRSGLILSRLRGSLGTRQLVEMDFKGEIKNILFAKPEADVGRVLLDKNQFVLGVEYTGLYPTYEFFDKSLQTVVEQVQDNFPDGSVELVDWEQSQSRLLFKVSGGVYPPAYHIYYRDKLSIHSIANQYSAITKENVMEVGTIEYKARDGYKIPGILTVPKDWSRDQKSPTIIMPHGGPESYDAVGFDWMAQYFASRGYLVLQPNFRGSTGFGARHRDAGRGGWGRGVMQHDVTDGLSALIKTGWTDPSKVCIVGASYGGYSALAGGAFTPDLYSCVVAIAPVSDVERMLLDEKRDNGTDSWVVRYWKSLIGDPRSEKEKLRNISPANFAEDFKAPVLLLHGNDDTVVPLRQSTVMERALKRAGKDVTMVRLKGEDHWLSSSDTRLATLKEMGEFVDRAIGSGN